MRQTTCTRCGQDIEGPPWTDRGGNRDCVPFEDHRSGVIVYPTGQHTDRPLVWGKYGTGKRRSTMTGEMVSYPESWETKHGMGRTKRRTTSRAKRRAGYR